MLSKLKDPHYQQYSPIAFGIGTIGVSLLGSILLAYKSLNIMPLLCLFGVFMLAGISLQLLSNRVVFIRIYQLLTITITVAVYLIVSVLFLTDGQPLWKEWVLTTALVTIVLVRGIFAFFRTPVNDS